MATPSPSPPVQITAVSSPLRTPDISYTPAVISDISSTPSVKLETPPPPPPLDAKPVGVAAVTARSPEMPNAPLPHVITVPSCSAWFSWDGIHETERKILPEFFIGKSASRNPEVYKYFRDSIIRLFRVNPSRKITFTEARRELAGDVGSVRRVFDFLEAWGLINYVSSTKPSKDKREAVETLEKKENPKKLCSSCKSVLSLACFMTDKSDIVLCARCYVRGNYRPGLSTSDFQRVDISEETRTDWTDKETLHLLEAILHYGDDWKKVAQHVGSRTEKECVARFIKLPFGEQFMGSLEAREDGMQPQKNDQTNVRSLGENAEEAHLLKRRRLTPLADASNPIMAQVAFLSAMVGSEAAGAAAQSALAALDGINMASISSPKGMEIRSSDNGGLKGENFPVNALYPPEVLKEAAAEAESQLKEEQREVEQFITDIAQVQMKQIQEEIEHFVEVELQMEKEWLQLRQMKDLFFADQLALLQYKARTASPETGDREMKTNDVT